MSDRAGGGANNPKTRRRSSTAAVLAIGVLVQACAMESGDGDSLGSATEAIVIVPPNYDPTFLCDYRMVAAAGGGALSLPYCATEDLGPANLPGPPPPLDHVRTLVISQHGRGSSGRLYLDTMNAVIDTGGTADAVGDGFVGSADEVFVIAPQFIEPEYAAEKGIPGSVLDELFVWGAGGVDYDWPVGGQSFREGAPGSQSSFELLERLLHMAIARMPNLEEIIFTGQSAGGQLVQRYALLNDFPFPRGVHVRYVPANAWGYGYPTGERPSPSHHTFSAPDFASYPGLEIYHDPQICVPDEEYPTCSEYDDYYRGLARIPVDHWAAQHVPLAYVGGYDPDPSYVENVDIDAVAARYAHRDVTYLVGEADILHIEQCACGDQLQGEHRRARAQHLSTYMRTEHGASSHQAVVVPDFAHGGGILRTQCGRAALFGAPELCDAMAPHAIASDNWTGTILSIAYGDVDGDSGQEMAVVEQRGSAYRVVLLDDRAAGYVQLCEPSETWTWAERGQDVAFGDVDGDGRDELAVARTTFATDSWLVYRWSGADCTLVDSGGADWPSPRSAADIAFGDIDGDGEDELAVTRNATSGARWYVYGRDGGGLSIDMSGSWPETARPTDVALGNLDGDAADELVVSRDAASGARMYLYQPGLLFGSPITLVTPIGAAWGSGNVVRHIAVGSMDSDGRHEILVGRGSHGGGSRWVVLDDSLSSFTMLWEGGSDSDPGWTAGASVSAVALGRIIGSYPAIAVAASTPSGPLLELATFDIADGNFAVGDYARPSVPADVRALAFVNLDTSTGHEIVYGLASTEAVSDRIRALPAP